MSEIDEENEYIAGDPEDDPQSQPRIQVLESIWHDNKIHKVSPLRILTIMLFAFPHTTLLTPIISSRMKKGRVVGNASGVVLYFNNGTQPKLFFM